MVRGTLSEWARVALTALVTLILSNLWRRLQQRRGTIKDQHSWEMKEDLGNVQFVLMTAAANLRTCGRVEKRTLLTLRLEQLFPNEYVRNMILDAASKCTDEEPFVCSHLSVDDRWQVLVAVQSHLSSLFGPYHLFSDQVLPYRWVLTLAKVVKYICTSLVLYAFASSSWTSRRSER
eukprot:TRINITY_DN21586_c0_g1_i2.p1 TRINITY_DN21586_c0_g1~~TRINITY_DN21586_c0_g1_i2.p1  ORF type:complete len:177 (-),score=18.60 TRINITY_DN21586_c0_g1_i2:659-1189(-)